MFSKADNYMNEGCFQSASSCGKYPYIRDKYLQKFLILHYILCNTEAVCLFVWFDFLRPINNLSVIKGQVFLGWTSTKLGFMFLLKDTTQWRRWGSNPRPFRLESSALPLSHCAPLLRLSFWLKSSLMLHFCHSTDKVVLLERIHSKNSYENHL